MPQIQGRRIFPQTQIGLGAAAMIAACFFSALCGAGFFYALRSEPGISPTAGIFIRILANFSCLLIPIAAGRRLPTLRRWQGNRSLWLWGVLGVVCTTSYYFAVPLVGSGLTMFLNAGSGIFVAALAPMLTGQRTARAHWFGAIGSFGGLYLLCLPGEGGFGSALGALLAVLSGLFGGLGYLLVARGRAAYRPETVMYHWAIVNLLAYGGFLFFFPPHWPAHAETWACFGFAGLCGAAAQYFTSVAYQKAPASLAACLCYLSPVLGLSLDACLFGFHFGPAELLGAAIVLGFGVFLPLLHGSGAKRSRHQTVAGSAEA